jgi:hypothetical protein
VNEEKVRGTSSFGEKRRIRGPEDAEFGHSERSGAKREPQEASMVTERQEEPQKAFKKAQYLQQQYGVRRILEGFPRIVSASVEDRAIDLANWAVHAPWIAPCRIHSDRSGPQIFEIFWTRGRALSREGSLPTRWDTRRKRGADALKWRT